MKKAIRIKICSVLILCLAILLLPCTYAQAAEVKISHKKLSMTVGESKKLTIQNIKKTIVWSTNNDKVAKVSKVGKVTAVSSGTATITAKVSGKKYTCNVTVMPKFSVNVLDSLQAEFMLQGLNLKEGEGADETGYAYTIAFDQYTVSLQHIGKGYTVINQDTGLIELNGISCFTANSENGSSIYTKAETYYRDNTLIIKLCYNLNYSDMDLCKTTKYECKMTSGEKTVSLKNANTEVITYTPQETPLPITYDLKASLQGEKTMLLQLTDSSLQEKYLIDRTESPANRGELSWTINFTCEGKGYSLALYRGAPVVGQDRIVSLNSLYLSYSKAELDENFTKLKGGEYFDDPTMETDGKTLIFRCVVPEGFNLSKVDGFAVSVVNQAIGLKGEGRVFKASEVLN